MTAPATVADGLLREFGWRLDDQSVSIDEFTLHRIVSQCTDAIPRAPAGSLAVLYSLMGNAFARLQRREDALSAFKTAARLNAKLATNANNVATAFLALGRIDDAMIWLNEALERPVKNSRDEFVILMNQSDLYRQLGAVDAAQHTLDRAIDHHNPENSIDLFMLAATTAVLGREVAAVDYFAKYLEAINTVRPGGMSSVEFIRLTPDDLKGRWTEFPALVQAIANTIVRLNGERFRSLSDEWHRDTDRLSLLSRKFDHPAYRAILEMGASAVPHILREIERRPSHWSAALSQLTGVNPVPAGAPASEACRAWVAWGREQGLLP